MNAMSQKAHDPIDDLGRKVDRLDGRVDGLRDGMTAEFTSVRREIKEDSTRVRSETQAGFDGVNEEFTKVRSEISTGFDSVNRLIIRGGCGMFFVLLAAIKL